MKGRAKISIVAVAVLTVLTMLVAAPPIVQTLSAGVLDSESTNQEREDVIEVNEQHESDHDDDKIMQVDIEGTIAPGEMVTVTAAADGEPMSDATVLVNGEPIDVTDEGGQAEIPVPNGNNFTVVVDAGSATGETHIDINHSGSSIDGETHVSISSESETSCETNNSSSIHTSSSSNSISVSTSTSSSDSSSESTTGNHSECNM